MPGDNCIWGLECCLSVLVPVGALASDVGLHLGRTTAVSPGDILLLLGLGLHLGVFFSLFLLGASLEGDAATHDDGIDVVSSEVRHKD